MGYNLPDHELFILNREHGISYKKLSEEWKCGQSTIGNHVRQFEELLENGEPKAIALYEERSMQFKDIPEYIDMIADMKMEQSNNYSDELEGVTDASPEEYETEEEIEQIPEANFEGFAGIEVDGNEPEEYLHESAEDMMPAGVRVKAEGKERGFWGNVWNVLKEIVWW